MKALSGRQPWWWAIVHAGKRVENRKWNTSYRGPILLHAAKGCTHEEYETALTWMFDHLGNNFAYYVPPLEELPRGGIVGRARIVDVLAPSFGDQCQWHEFDHLRFVDTRWHMPDQYGFVLDNVEALPFVPCKGALGLFELAEP